MLLSKFRALQDATARVDSFSSSVAPGSTRAGQGVGVTKKWMKLGAQGTPSYIQVRLSLE